MPTAYAAFLRGISPTNASMPVLRQALEDAGFTDARTVLASGNASFVTRLASEASVQKKVDAALREGLGRDVLTILRTIDHLRALLDADPFARFALAPGEKRVVTFLAVDPPRDLRLPAVLQGARIHAVQGRDALTSYVRQPGQPFFMTLIERTFGKDVTTRTWETVQKVVASQSDDAAPARTARVARRPGRGS